MEVQPKKRPRQSTQSQGTSERTAQDQAVIRNLQTQLSKKRDPLATLEQQILTQLADDNIEGFAEEAGTLIDEVKSTLYDLQQLVSDSAIDSTAETAHHTDSTPTYSAIHQGVPLIETPQPPTHDHQKHHVHLPKLQLPMFDGDALQWLSFIDHFDSAVGNEPSLAPVQKLQYLSSRLSGDAAIIIKGLPLTNSSYIDAIALLRSCYGNIENLTSAYTKAVLEIKAPTRDVHSLRRFHDKLETLLRGLKTLDSDISSNSSLLISIVKQKLPVDVRTQI